MDRERLGRINHEIFKKRAGADAVNWPGLLPGVKEDFRRAAEAVAAAVLPAGHVAVEAGYLAALLTVVDAASNLRLALVAWQEAADGDNGVAMLLTIGRLQGADDELIEALAALRQRPEWAGKEATHA